MYRIGIDIGGTKVNIGLFHQDRTLLACQKIYVSDMPQPVRQIRKTILELCQKTGISYENLASCGVGIPGTVDETGKKILKMPNIRILSENFAEQLETELNIPVNMVQDSRAAAWGEYLQGGYPSDCVVVCITLGTGIGTGIVVNGQIYNGSLGCAGEIGHIPAVENGRPCGCGKRGCLEKYCAGGGLDLTAAEVLGEGKTAFDLFEEAKSGNETAKSEIQKAVTLLGKEIVSVINLLSPYSILFSGGLSEQEELYLTPLIAYIKQHCYQTTQLPELKKAALGEMSPLFGAAFLPRCLPKRKAMLSASVMCADMLHLERALWEIEEAGIEYLHCDMMDNHFVPNMMMPVELLNQLRNATNLPFDFHIMAERPETIIEKLEVKTGDIISVHYESTVHLQRVITMIKEKGAKASVALNPATPVGMLEEILSELDMVLIMSVNPGFSGQKLVPTSLEKISKMRKILTAKGLDHIKIQVDGNCSFENVPKMYQAGADIFVVGTSSVFQKGMNIKQGTEKLLDLLSDHPSKA